MKRIKQFVRIGVFFCVMCTILFKAKAATIDMVKIIRTNVTYPTITAALANAQDGDTIVLLEDIRESVVYKVETGITVHIDGQGHRVTGIEGDLVNQSSTALTLSGNGLIYLKHITFEGGVSTSETGCSYGLFLAIDSTVDVQTEGMLQMIGGNAGRTSYGVYHEGNGIVNVDAATGGVSEAYSSGVHNNGLGTINVMTAIGGKAKDRSTGACNEEGGTVNVFSATGGISDKISFGVHNNGPGTINVTTATGGTANLGSYGVWSYEDGAVNVGTAICSAAEYKFSVYNNGSSTVNIGKAVGTIFYIANTEVTGLSLVTGSNEQCVLDSITVSNRIKTKIGALPCVSCNGAYSNRWFTDSEKTMEFIGTTVPRGTTTLFSSFYNTISGKIIGSDTGEGIAASIQLKDKEGQPVGGLVTAGSDGSYRIEASVGKGYTIEVSMNGYELGTIPAFDLIGTHVIGMNLTLHKTISAPIIQSNPLVQVAQINLENSNLSMIKGNSYQLKVTSLQPENASNKTVKWTSSNPTIVSVNKTGKVKAKKPGIATIKVSAEDGSGVESTCFVTVTESSKTSIQLFWIKAPKATGYQVTLYRGKKVIKTLYTKNNYASFKKLTAATTYRAVVKIYQQKGEKKKEGAQIAIIDTATKPSIPVIRAKEKRRAATLLWKKVSGASGYEIVMNTKKNSRYPTKRTICKGKKVSFTFKQLKKGRTYYFMIRAYKKVDNQKVYGSYSLVKSVKVK